MTKEEFEVLQLDLQQSGKSIKAYLQHVGVSYNTYNYWRKKMMEKESPKPELAPISFTQPSDPVFASAVRASITVGWGCRSSACALRTCRRFARRWA